jgi:cysteine desulfurase/selenocysteine lyase
MIAREKFPILANNPSLVYLDSACTSLKPLEVIEAEKSYYTGLGACGGRSSHSLGRKTTEKIEEAREKVASFVNAKAEELVWTRNATEALNIVISGLDYSKRNKVVTSVLEHHSVLLPLMRLREKGKIKLEIINCDSKGEITKEQWSGVIGRETALVITNSGNNTTGTAQGTAAIAKIAHDNGALICVDGAQGVPHSVTDFKKTNFDFLCFSAHKMLGPTGMGALIAKKEHLKNLEPLLAGGGTVKTVSLDNIVELQGQERFEAGVQNYGGMLGFGAACDFLKKIGMENIEAHGKKLGRAMRQELLASGAKTYGLENAESTLCSFNFPHAKPHDVALMLDRENVAVRSGFFCAQPAMEALGAKEGAVRASCYIYNSMEDIRKFSEALRKISVLYK